MHREIYIDVVFAANFLMDYILLRLAGILLHLKAASKRCAAGAAFGAFLACLTLYIPADGTALLMIRLLLQGVGAYGMLRIGYGISRGIPLLRALMILYLTAFLSGGFWQAISGGVQVTLWIFLLCSLFTYAGIGILLGICDTVRIHRKNIYPVTLSWQRKTQSAYGLYDTGNLMTDPVSGAPVSLVEPELLKSILTGELLNRLKHLKENPGELKSTEIAALKPHYLLCRTAGGEGLILAVTLEELLIRTPKEVVRVKNPVLALAEEPSALGCEYRVLLNSRLLH